MRRATTVAAVTLSIFAAAFAGVARAESSFEEQPVLKASDLAPAAMLKGPRFTVDDRVPVANLLGQFTLRSDFGVFEVHGRDLLGIRVVEVGAIDQIENTSKSAAFLEAAGKTAARPVKAAANMVMNPVETVKGAPAAVGRFFDRVDLGAKAIAASAKGNGTTGEKTAAVTKRVGGVTADVMGYEEERRALAKRLRVDPYTTNPVLSEKMNDLAWVSFSGRVGLNTVIAVAVPFSMAISATSITNDMVWDMKPADLLKRDEQRLAAMGAGAQRVTALVHNKWYSVTTLTALVDSLEKLAGVKGREQVVAFAALAPTEDKARLIVGATAMLASWHQTMAPLAQLSAPGPIIARTKAGAVFVPAPVDYVSWSEPVAKFAGRGDVAAKERTVWVTGTLSPRAKEEFAAASWVVREGPTPR